MIQKEGKTVFGPVEHPWFDPLWRRYLLVAVCAGWTGVEYYFGSTTWFYVTLGITVYAGWSFLYYYKGPDDPARKPKPETNQDEE
ncbi:hypothetical protein [Roseibium marinum]|uniref:DUF3329 domain-containing protein n=1 Tax=Roseibium marinum TaxID=281252 RepID=A0A2S3V4I1_9HYPH|nr:hypothetical protein [Roseibium marinum]POF34858.1 hypothetical protein CLV41_1011318 [Roseibium marinum]